MSGCMESERAMATLCFCPPDSCFGLALTNESIPTFARYSCAVFSASARLFFSTVTCGQTQFSSTFMLLNRLNCWNTIPTLARYEVTLFFLSEISFPSKMILPPVGSSSRFMHLSIVLLPEPDEPITLITSPLLTERFISLSTT